MAEISDNGLRIQRHRGYLIRIARYAAAGVALFAATGIWLFRGYLLNGNFHTVIPNEVYRSGQLSPEVLERRIRELSLHSVINLRTSEETASWFKGEQEATKIHGVDLHLIRLTASMPSRKTLQQLVHLLDSAKRPLLLHCARGVERSGIASAVAVLLSGRNTAEARKQFRLTYGFAPLISNSDLPKMFDDYDRWLAVRGWSHTPEQFRRWVDDDYVPYFYRARLEPLDVPASIVRGSKVLMHFRATNISLHPWRFRSDRDRGIHLGAVVQSFESSAEQEFELRGGFRNLIIGPGESVVLEIEIPATFESGRYKFSVDLVDEHVNWFSEMGSNPITFELRVEDPDARIANRGKGCP